jgi:predicted acylesterase/phospholipase RssA
MPDPAPPAPADPYAHPKRSLDIVMKGGITSGVVYPLAVAELAQVFRFRSIGGTSAGAIAAAATAAAEHGRQTGKGGGFAGLADLPRRLTEILPDGRSRLFSLFQPAPKAAPAFAVAVAALRARSGRGKVAAALFRTLWTYPLGAGLGALPGLLPALALAFDLAAPQGPGAKLSRIVALALSLLVAGLGALVGSCGFLVVRAVRALAGNAFGLCRGLAEPGTETSEAPPLTPWLDDLLSDLAGKPKMEGPLTFGDLWRAGLPAAPGTTAASSALGDTGDDDTEASDVPPPAERSIDLQMMTTCLSLCRPFRIPFEDQRFHFKESELRRFFPETVARWMIDHARPDDRLHHPTHEGEPLLGLPPAADLPVVFAARLSLSFPLLLSAFPLYAVDPDAIPAAGPGQRRQPPLGRCWFSDGGLASNLPIHFFDAPLPAWPTVAIDLLAAGPGHPLAEAPADNVFLPKTNVSGILEGRNRFDEAASGLGQLTGFIGSLLSVMQNWRDEALSRLPGQRDRIAHVLLGESEGGLNLEMPPDAVRRLAERGRWAGIKLRHRFGGADAPADGLTDKLSWDNHRWVRFAEALPALQDLLAAFARVHDEKNPGERTFEELIERPPAYATHRTQAQKRRLTEMTGKLAQLGREMAAIADHKQESFHRGEPHPPGELKVRPRI